MCVAMCEPYRTGDPSIPWANRSRLRQETSPVPAITMFREMAIRFKPSRSAARRILKSNPTPFSVQGES